MVFFDGRQERQPVDDVVIAQASWTVLQIGFEMKYGIAEFSVARAREVREAFDDLRGIARNQLWNHVIVQTREESAVAGEMTAIQQGNRELRIFRIEAAAFRESARGGTELQSQIQRS